MRYSLSNNTRGWPRVWLLMAILAVSGSAVADTDEDSLWLGGLRAAYFGERPIVQSDDVIELEAPIRAEDSAVVPIRIKAKIPQTDERYIKTITLIIDMNPGQLAGRFNFTPKNGRADLGLRIRVNAYGPVRAIAETNDGKLYMSRRFVKASGGCSAAVGTDIEAAKRRLGKMKFKTDKSVLPGEPLAVQLRVSHPNLTGLQMDQITHLYTMAHYVEKVKITFEGQPVFSAETGFSMSENPSFRFNFVPDGAGELHAEVIDTEGLRFTGQYSVVPGEQRAEGN
ncbi:MAG: quinoprotein dehydrogenase-associated SoxYZ-like carrier [Gammaproteobacteria bacterium]|nr:quinoprotein dehydrogenase-associated SoxYZ-like carrier [Gammaproteobacteria bacterium]